MIELMIAVAIVGILAVMGVSSYRNSRYEGAIAVIRQDAIRAAAAAEAQINRGGTIAAFNYTQTGSTALGFTPSANVHWGIYAVPTSGLSGTIYTRHSEIYDNAYCYAGVNTEPSRVVCFELQGSSWVQRN